jgi:UDP-N-acetylglucosamine 3-dehydrogenase
MTLSWRLKKMKRLRVGVIGCGFVASKWHIPSFMLLKKRLADLVVCDLNPALSTSVAKQFSLSTSYSSVSEMLKNENLDIVDICTPPHTHASLAIEAMESGCHVLLEKPMALKLSDCDEMIRISKRQSVKLCVIHNELFRPPMIKARELVEKGELGKVLGMQWSRFTPREEYLARESHWIHKLPGGVLGETGPHAVYASLAFLKKIKNVEISARNLLKYPWAPYDYFNVTLEGEEINSSIILSHASDNFVAEVSVFGTDEILKMDLQNMMLARYKLKETRMVPLAMSSLRSAGQAFSNVVSNGLKVFFARNSTMRVRGHPVEIEKFVNSVISDQQPPVTGEEGRETVRVMEAIVEKLNRKTDSEHLGH